jgi:glycerol uptake facilitator-like aquaporin
VLRPLIAETRRSFRNGREDLWPVGEISPFRRAVAEGIGTTLLAAVVVGSGIMGERLAGGNVALALLANSFATGAGLVALIITFTPLSGAHLNPVVTLADAWERRFPWGEVPAYLVAQLVGAFLGVAVANETFGGTLFSISQHSRPGMPQRVGELVASFGFLLVVRGTSGMVTAAAAAATGAYIAAAYWFAASTAFANPALTLARAMTDTFAGIRPNDVPGFVLAQLFGAWLAVRFRRWVQPTRRSNGQDFHETKPEEVP